MRFVCLGYMDEEKWDGMTDAERSATMKECFAYDDQLRREGRFLGGEALQSAQSAATLRFRGGRVEITDGPFAETKEQLGGILILEARDLSHAVEIMSRHPGVRFGPFEIRAADDSINALIEAGEAPGGAD